MGKLKQQQSDVFGQLAAVNTLLERYPVLTTTDPMLTNFSMNTSIGFLLSLIEVLAGLTQADMINWICRLLGDEDGGILVPIEYAIKGILMANIKGMFTCSFDPILPDNLMKYVVQSDTPRQDPSAAIPWDADKKSGIAINIPSIDMFGLLANCPSNKRGGVFYFDAFDPARVSTLPGESGATIVVEDPHYIPNELYKSRDFNAFLWYVINKGNIGSPSDLQKNTWDNRNKVYKKYENSETIKKNFFKTVDSNYASKPKIPIYANETPSQNEKPVLDKEQYIICQYAEKGSNQAYSNVLNVWLNADRYYRTRKLKVPKKDSPGEFEILAVNKTAYEFNYDYIYSLKLFDTKTLVANIMNSLLGLGSSFSVSFSFEQKQVQKKVEEMVEKIMMEDDTQVAEDCFYKFDNTTYQQMIDEVTNSYQGSYTDPLSTYSPDFTDVYDALASLGNVTEKAGQAELLKRVLQTGAERYTTGGENASSSMQFNFTMGADFIMDFIKQTVVQIVLQVLSPKVAVLFAINGEIMGSTIDDSTFTEIPDNIKKLMNGNFSAWEDFLRGFDNLIRNIVISVKDIIVKELYNFMMEQLKPLLELLIAKLALETVKYYRDLIMNLILNCIPTFNFGNNSSIIDNVNYADIINDVPKDNEQTEPELPC